VGNICSVKWGHQSRGAGQGQGTVKARGGGSHWANQEEGAGNNQWLPGVSAALHLRPAIFSLPFSRMLSREGRGLGSNGSASLDRRWTRRWGKEINGRSEDILICDLDKIRQTWFPFHVLSMITKRSSFSQYAEIFFCCKNDQILHENLVLY
jgi:hypothetical protein